LSFIIHQSSFIISMFPARHAAESLHPRLWRGLTGLWVPALGPTGTRLFDRSPYRRHGDIAAMNSPSLPWRVSQRGWHLYFRSSWDTGEADLWDFKILSLPFTLAMLVRCDGGGSGFFYGGAGPEDMTGVQCFTDPWTGQINVYLGGAEGDPAQGNSFLTDAGITDNDWHSLVAIARDMSDVQVIVDGADWPGTVLGTATTFVGYDGPHVIGVNAWGATNMAFALCLAAERAWSVSEAVEFCRDPLGLLRRRGGPRGKLPSVLLPPGLLASCDFLCGV
jgi:hypothetical protein